MEKGINNASTGIHELHELQRIVDELHRMNEQFEEASYNAAIELGHIIRIAKEFKARSERLRKQRKREREKKLKGK